MTTVFEWTALDQEKALADGWGVFENTDHGLRVERHDSLGRFDCDAAAIAYVAAAALCGNQHAAKAVYHLAWSQAVLDAAERSAEEDDDRVRRWSF